MALSDSISEAVSGAFTAPRQHRAANVQQADSLVDWIHLQLFLQGGAAEGATQLKRMNENTFFANTLAGRNVRGHMITSLQMKMHHYEPQVFS